MACQCCEHTPGAFMDAELHSQPEMWERALTLPIDALPKPGERVVAIGCGTSWFMAQSYAALRENSGNGITDAFTATAASTAREYDVAIVFTRSGTTSEIITYLEELRDSGSTTRTIALLGDLDTPVAQLADTVIDLSFADEKSVVQTRFATTALTYLRRSIHSPEIIAASIEDAREALAAPLDPALVNAEQYSFLGQDWAYGLAIEAGLKMRESCQAWTESYNSMEYRHGPIAIAAPGRVTWQLGTAPSGLAEQVKETGATFISSHRDPLAELVRIHKVALETSRARGLDADHPRNLTRSVILN